MRCGAVLEQHRLLTGRQRERFRQVEVADVGESATTADVFVDGVGEVGERAVLEDEGVGQFDREVALGGGHGLERGE